MRLNTYNRVVRAAHRARGARVAAPDTNDGQRGAVETEETSHVAEDDTQETEQDAGLGRGGLCHSSDTILTTLKNTSYVDGLVAALNGASVALARRGHGRGCSRDGDSDRGVVRHRCGDRKKGDREQNVEESSVSASEHVDCVLRRQRTVHCEARVGRRVCSN